MNWLELAKSKREEFVKITKELLQIPSVLKAFNPENKEMPFGPEIKEALDYLLDLGKADGFIVKNVDNYAGHIEYGSGDEVLGILGHLDVVPAGGKWTNPPFSAYEEDGKIYARGSMDDKGPTVAAYIALKLVKEQGIKLNKKVRIILGCDEETGMRGLIHYLKKEKMPDIGFSPDAEFPLIYAEKGIAMYDFLGKEKSDLILSLTAGERYNVVPDECIAELSEDKSRIFYKYLKENNIQGSVDGHTYTILGKNGHAAMPDLAVNAISLMVGFLDLVSEDKFVKFMKKYLYADNYGKKLGIHCYDEEMKDLTNNLSLVRYDGEDLRIGLNMRYPRNYNFEQGEKNMSALASEYGLDYKFIHNSVPHYVSPEEDLVKILYDTYVKYTNDTEHKIMTIGGGTYARRLDKAVAFGALFPGDEELAHQPNEYLDIDKMLVSIAIFAESIVRLAGE